MRRASHVMALLVACSLSRKIGGLPGILLSTLVFTFIEIIFMIVFGSVSAGWKAQWSPDPTVKRRVRLASLFSFLISLPWLGYVFWMYRNGPYVSLETAFFDCLPLVLIAWAIGMYAFASKKEGNPANQSTEVAARMLAEPQC